jgi:hypothetical protein
VWSSALGEQGCVCWGGGAVGRACRLEQGCRPFVCAIPLFFKAPTHESRWRQPPAFVELRYGQVAMTTLQSTARLCFLSWHV